MTALLLWALRIIVILLVVRLVLRMLYRATTSNQPPRGRVSKKPERIGGALVRDPNCGTYITRERAVTSGTGDTTQYFCSTECRDAYRIKASA